MSVQALQQTAALAFEAEAFLSRLWALDELLQSRGFHPLSAWWRGQFERFVHALAAGQGEQAAALVRRWVLRCGRRAGKSSSLARLVCAWARWGAWHVPAGDIAVVAFVSISRDEAAQRLRTIAQILHVLGARFDERQEEIEVSPHGDWRPCLFKVFGANAKSVGFTSIAVVCDEAARWESRDTAANPAREVVASLAPTMATQPFAFLVMCSSPWGTDDYHAECFEAGETPYQVTSFAATWTANPTITEERTHELEPDQRIWQREYAAIPGATLSDAFDATDLTACFRPVPAFTRYQRPFCAIDASSLRGDAFTFLLGALDEAGETIIVTRVGGWEGPELHKVSMADVARDIAYAAQGWGTRDIFADQREEAALSALFLQHGCTLHSFAWSESSKDQAFQAARRWMRDQALILPDHPTLRRELTSLKARMTPSGRISYATSGLDYASALISFAHAVVAGVYQFEPQHRYTRAGRGYTLADSLVQRARGGDTLTADEQHRVWMARTRPRVPRKGQSWGW